MKSQLVNADALNNVNDVLGGKKHLYRLLYVDNNQILPNVDFIIPADNKKEAEEIGYDNMASMAFEDLKMVLNGAARMSGNALRISRKYMNFLIHDQWTLVECERQDSTSLHESKRTVDEIKKKASDKKSRHGKKRRWTNAQKEAARKAREEEALFNPSVVLKNDSKDNAA